MLKLLNITFVLPLLFAEAANGNLVETNCIEGVCRVEGSGNACGNPVVNRAVVRVVNQTDRGRNLGSGTLIKLDVVARHDANVGFVLTCGHLFTAGTEQSGRITVSFPDGSNFEARLLGVDREWDLAVLKIARPRTVAVKIATVAPRPGQWLTSCGYGRDGRFWCNRGQARGYVRPEGTSSFETLEISGVARQGDSGGPVFNQCGELVAVLWGTNGQIVGGTYCGRIRIFLSRLFGAKGKNPSESRQPSTVEPNVQRPIVPVRPESGRRQREEQGSNDALEQIRQRLEGLETRLGGSELGEKVRAMAREVARDAAGRVIEDYLAEHGETAVPSWVPGLMAALGWTGPPAIAATVGITVFGRLLRRRIRKRLGKKQCGGTEIVSRGRDDGRKTKRPLLNDSYAEQLADVYALSGHSRTADATLGREYDAELRQAETSSDGALAAWARELRERVAQRFYRIHDKQPMPAEPVDET